MTETWLPVTGFEGLYEVSDLGNVRSLLSGKVLRPVLHSAGYLQVSLKRRWYYVHRLVAAAFVAGDNSLQVNHRNGRRDDNRASNLEWVTCSENHKHSYRELSRKPHALSRAVVLRKGDEVLAFPTQTSAANYLKTNAGHVSSRIRQGWKIKGWEVTYG